MRAHQDHPDSVVALATGTDHRLLLTVEEGADRLGIGRSLMYELIGTGQIASVQLGRLRRIPPEALSDYVTRLRAAAPPGVSE